MPEEPQEFQGWLKPTPQEVSTASRETFAYVSDIHGDPRKEFLPKLDALLEKPPQFLIFMGDIIGTQSLERLQQLFYNHVTSHSRPGLTDDELLETQITLDQEPELGQFNLKDGFLHLRRFELELTGKKPEEINQVLEKLTDQQIASEVRRYSKFVHYGHYASNLPFEVKERLAKGLEENASEYTNAMHKFQDKGTKVYVLQGNWDARTPIDFEPGDDQAIPLPPDQRPFNVGKFFDSENVPFITKLESVETQTSLQILVPFDAIVNFPQANHEDRMKLLEKIADARLADKTIIVVAHGEPDWEVHNLDDPSRTPPLEHQQILTGFQDLLGWTLPDEVVHGHLHFQRTNEKGQKIDPNWKTIMKKMPDGSMQLVKNNPGTESKLTAVTVSYVPWRTIGDLEISTVDRKRGVQGIDGVRNPVTVT